MNCSEVKFYENYLTSDFHTNTVISGRVCLPIKMASKTVIRSIYVLMIVFGLNRVQTLLELKHSLGHLSYTDISLLWRVLTGTNEILTHANRPISHNIHFLFFSFHPQFYQGLPTRTPVAKDSL